jgi:hypothetical protein
MWSLYVSVLSILNTSELMDFDETWSDDQKTTYYSKSVFLYLLQQKTNNVRSWTQGNNNF